MKVVFEVPRVRAQEVSAFRSLPRPLGGYWWESEQVICVPVVWNTQPGDGSFGRFLQFIENKGKIVFFPTVISARLTSILRSRGYDDAFAMDEHMGFVDGLARKRLLTCGGGRGHEQRY